MSILKSKMSSQLQRYPDHLSMAIYLSLLAMALIVRTTLAAAVLNSYNLSSFTPPSQDVTLNRFVVHNRTGNIYVAAEKLLFRLGSDLQSLESTSTSSCAEDDNCDDITKILAISQGDAESLIICTSAEGKCEVRDLSDIEQVVHSSNIMVPGESTGLTAVGVITEVAQGGNIVEKFYVANTLSADVTMITHPIIRWTVSDSFNQADELNHYALGVAVNSFPISYKETFTHNGFVYFVMNQVGNVKLGRVCETARMEYYSEITLGCDSRNRPDTSYDLVQAARVGKAGSALRMSMGSDSDSSLYAVFSESDSVSSNAALCVYSMTDVEAAFLQAVKDCLSGTQDARLSYLNGATCDELILPDEILLGLMCSQELSFTYANGIHPLVSSAAVEMSSHVPTSIVSAVVIHHTVVFIGTQEGDLLKVHVMSNTTGRLYETVPLGSTPILPDMFNDQDTSILTANQQSLFRLPVADCEQYSTCGECIGGAGDDDSLSFYIGVHLNVSCHLPLFYYTQLCAPAPPEESCSICKRGYNSATSATTPRLPGEGTLTTSLSGPPLPTDSGNTGNSMAIIIVVGILLAFVALYGIIITLMYLHLRRSNHGPNIAREQSVSCREGQELDPYTSLDAIMKQPAYEDIKTSRDGNRGHMKAIEGVDYENQTIVKQTDRVQKSNLGEADGNTEPVYESFH